LATKAIKLNYLSAERFFKDYERLCTGKIFLPTQSPLPLKTRISLNITVPDIEEVLTVEGSVNSRTSTGGTAASEVEKALAAAEADLGIE